MGDKTAFNRTRNSNHKWYVPVFFFIWSAGFLFGGIHLLSGGELWTALHDGAKRVLVRMDTHPYQAWTRVIVFFLTALAGICAGVLELRKFIRQQRTRSEITMQDFQ